MHFVIAISKFFDVDFAIKVNASNERRFDRSTVILKFGVRKKISCVNIVNALKYIQTIDNKNKRLKIGQKTLCNWHAKL